MGRSSAGLAYWRVGHARKPRHDERDEEHSAQEKQAPVSASRHVLDVPDAIWSDEAAEISDRVDGRDRNRRRSEEHTSELQSRLHLVCRLLLEKKKRKSVHILIYTLHRRVCESHS